LGVRVVRPALPPHMVRAEINTPPVSQPEDLPSIALSPDGQQLAFVAAVDGQPNLWVRRLDTGDARPLTGTAGAAQPFWSPDSRTVAFYADSRLKRIDLDGGLVRTLAQGIWGGGAWNRDGVILFASSPASPILRTSESSGGAGTAVTRLEKTHASHSFPHFLPDGRHFLYYVNADAEARGVWLGQLDGSTARRLFDADSAPAYASGHIFFLRQKTVFAQAFDPERLELKGTPIPVEDGAVPALFEFGPAALSASEGGAIAFRLGSASSNRQFVWVDRSGKDIRKVGNPDHWTSPSASPDFTQLAVLKRDATGNADVWLIETRRGVLTRFTTHPKEDVFPVWSPDGSRLAFQSNRDGFFGFYQKRTSGVATEELLLNKGAVGGILSDWSPDDQFLLYFTLGTETGSDVWALPLRGGGKAFPVVRTEADERDGQFSPDGKWIAYASNSSGRFEIYMSPFPGPGAAIQVSTGGGAQVRWRHDGRGLFYIGLDRRLMEAPIQVASDGRPIAGAAVPLFTTRIGVAIQPAVPGSQYVVSADGQSFLMNTLLPDSGPTPVRLIVNWKPQR
jgi:Tol biopolymer transport system component